MEKTGAIQRRRREILAELAGLEQVRRGSVTEQFVEGRSRGGRPWRGPYPIFTCKAGGKTVSRRLKGEEAERLRQQVEGGHRFQKLVRELMELGEALCENTRRDDAVKKTPKS